MKEHWIWKRAFVEILQSPRSTSKAAPARREASRGLRGRHAVEGAAAIKGSILCDSTREEKDGPKKACIICQKGETSHLVACACILRGAGGSFHLHLL